MIFEAGAVFHMMTSEDALESVASDDLGLAVRAVRLHELVKVRDYHFRRSVMADSAMAMMLSLFLGELKVVSLTVSTLALVNMLDDDETRTVIESLVQAGLAAVTGANAGTRDSRADAPRVRTNAELRPEPSRVLTSFAGQSAVPFFLLVTHGQGGWSAGWPKTNVQYFQTDPDAHDTADSLESSHLWIACNKTFTYAN